MDNQQREAVLSTVPAILEQQAFLFADALSQGGFKAQGEEYLAASLVFDGPSRGGALAAFPESLARELAANLLGAEPGDEKSAEHAGDALGEFLNVACGHLLTTLFGTGTAFNLGSPRIFGFPSAVADLLARKSDVMAFEIDGVPILFQACFCAPYDPEEALHA
ncbi:MAG: chemotaxis protein CheX [Fibrobacteres bacterium]|nr:chemotaxis protein CheX [Fibrobacterota bacterium]